MESTGFNGTAREGFKSGEQFPGRFAELRGAIARALAARDGREVKTWCPVHELRGREDATPSLGVKVNARGKFYATCWSQGCAGVEKELRRLEMLPRPRIIASYVYEDETGEPLFYVDRWDPKAFTQRAASGKSGAGAMKGVRRVPFRLRQLLEAPLDAWILIPEGERDVLTAVMLGYDATCNSGGAGKFLAEFAAYLKGKRIAVLPDAGEVGEAHGRSVARTSLAVAAEVRIVRMPDGHKDLSDAVAAGLTRDQLQALIDEAPTLTAADVAPTADESAGDQSYAAVKARMDELFAVDTITHEIFDQRTGESISPHVFDKIAGATFHHNDPDKGPVSTAPGWRADANRAQRAGRVWLPGEPNPTVRNEFNLFKPLPGVTRAMSLDEAVANLQTWYFPLRDHVYSVPRERRYFEQLTALKRQNAAFKVPVGIMLWGDPGVGKSLLFEASGLVLFGPDYF
jgi:hypothetical protein